MSSVKNSIISIFVVLNIPKFLMQLMASFESCESVRNYIWKIIESYCSADANFNRETVWGIKHSELQQNLLIYLVTEIIPESCVQKDCTTVDDARPTMLTKRLRNKYFFENLSLFGAKDSPIWLYQTLKHGEGGHLKLLQSAYEIRLPFQLTVNMWQESQELKLKM